MNIGEQWVEYLFLIVLVLGFIFAIFIKSVFLILLVSFLFGVFFSKLLAFDKKRSNLPYILIVLGFVVGFFVGSLLSGISSWVRFFCLVFFIIGAIAGNIFKKKLSK